jgi:hypothetical protein
VDGSDKQFTPPRSGRPEGALLGNHHVISAPSGDRYASE